MLFSNNFETSIGRLYLMGDVASGTNRICSDLGIGAGSGSLYVALHTANPGEGSTGTECAYGSYARVAVARSTASWTETAGAPTTYANASSITFPQASSGTETATHWALWTQPKGTANEKMLCYGPLIASGANWQVGYVQDHTNDRIYCVAHGYSNDDPIIVYSPYDGINGLAALPAATPTLALGSTYYVYNKSTDYFQIDDVTPAAAAIDFSALGTLIFIKATSLSISTGVIPSFTIGALEIAIA